MDLVEHQERIARRLRTGGSLAHVEAEIIEPSLFSQEQKAALWLYASVTIPRHRQRRPAKLPSALASDQE